MHRFHATAFALSLACTIGEDPPTHTPEGIVDLESALLVRSRDHLQVCLQVDPALASQTAAIAARLRDDLGHLEAHRDWSAAGLDRGAIEVVIGCPGGASVDHSLDAKGAGGSVLGPGMTMTPSPFRAHVHAIADTHAAAVLGDEAFALFDVISHELDQDVFC